MRSNPPPAKHLSVKIILIICISPASELLEQYHRGWAVLRFRGQDGFQKVAVEASP